MKKYLSLLFVFLLILLFISGCQNATDPVAEDEPIVEENDSGEASPEHTEEPIEQPEDSTENDSEVIDNTFEFSLKIAEDKYITLRDYEREMNVEEFLGQPTNVSIEMLGSSADTFQGSLVKTMEYDGLTLKLFAPETNFWLMDAYVTNEQLETFREISVGDSLNQLKSAYEGLEQVPDGRTDENNAAYIFKDEMNYNYLMFEIEDGVIEFIRMYHEMP